MGHVWGTGYFVAVCVCGLPLFSCMLFSPVGNCVMAVSAYSARFCIHFFFLACMLYLGPFCNKDISELEKEMSVLLTTRGETYVFPVVLVFESEKALLVFCLRSCILFGFLFEVFLQVFLECTAMFCPMCGPGINVIGIIVGLVVVSCYVGILSHL